MSAPPAVSVVVPARDRSRALVPTLASVLDQELRELELVVVDDGSHDDTARVAETMGDPRLHLVRLPFSRGTAQARNAGARAARGALLLFLDHDDRLLPGGLGALAGALAAAPGSVGLAYGGFVLENAASGRRLARLLPAARVTAGRLLAANRLGCLATMVRRPLFEAAGGFDPDQLYEDWDLWLRLAAITRFVRVPRLVAAHGIHPGQQTASVERALEARRRLAAKHAGRLAGAPAAAARQCLQLGLLALVAGRVELARAELSRARQCGRWRPAGLAALLAAWLPPGPAATLLRRCCLSLGRAGVYW